MRATAWSCSSGVNVTGVAPHARASSVTSSTAAGSASSWGVIAHGRPSNSAADAANGPERSLPASGWLPT